MELLIMRNKNHEHEDQMHQPLLMGYGETYVKLAASRTIFFSEDVTKKSAAELSAMLLYYNHKDSEAPIALYLNSNGGDASGLANIYDVMQMITAPITTILMGKCYSAGAVILAAGAKGHRLALKSSKVMIHGIQFGFPLPDQDLTTSKNYFEYLTENNDTIMKILAKHTGHSLAKLKADCAQDKWLSAKQSLDYGIIDEIIG
jgi:ATP-dependent Clp protease protease subunit